MIIVWFLLLPWILAPQFTAIWSQANSLNSQSLNFPIFEANNYFIVLFWEWCKIMIKRAWYSARATIILTLKISSAIRVLNVDTFLTTQIISDLLPEFEALI